VKAAIFLACALASAAIHADTVLVQGFSRPAYDALFASAR
jgi:hypothetical protein